MFFTFGSVIIGLVSNLYMFAYFYSNLYSVNQKSIVIYFGEFVCKAVFARYSILYDY